MYFNKNIYCFSGADNAHSLLKLSERFDIDKNQWFSLSPMEESEYCWHSIEVNGDILISGWKSTKILSYIIKRNVFIKMPFQFEAEKRKILIKAEKLYLVECGGFVYEKDIGGIESNWKTIVKSIISNCCPYQGYGVFNKELLYIGIYGLWKQYYKLDLQRPIMNELK